MAPKKAVKAPAAKKREPSPEAAPVDVLRAEEKAARDFMQDVASASGCERDVAQKAIDALIVVVGRQVREKQYCRIPNMMQFRLKILPARVAQTRRAFGKEVQVSARAAVKKVNISPLKPLKQAVE